MRKRYIFLHNVSHNFVRLIIKIQEIVSPFVREDKSYVFIKRVRKKYMIVCQFASLKTRISI